MGQLRCDMLLVVVLSLLKIGRNLSYYYQNKNLYLHFVGTEPGHFMQTLLPRDSCKKSIRKTDELAMGTAISFDIEIIL